MPQPRSIAIADLRKVALALDPGGEDWRRCFTTTDRKTQTRADVLAHLAAIENNGHSHIWYYPGRSIYL